MKCPYCKNKVSRFKTTYGFVSFCHSCNEKAYKKFKAAIRAKEKEGKP